MTLTAHEPKRPTQRPFAVSPDEGARLAGLGRTTVYAAIRSGALASLKIGRRRLIRIDVLEAWLQAHER